MLSFPIWHRKEVNNMYIIASFIISLAAGMCCHYLCKWLERKHKDDN